MARVPYRDPDDLPAGIGDLVVSSLQPGKTVNVYRAVANNPAVLEGLRDYLGALWSESGLTDRERELVVLAVARELDNAYEWHQHVGIARSVGVADETIRAIGAGSLDAAGLDGREAAMVRYGRAVVRGEVDDGLHAAVAGGLDDDAVAGLAALAAGYAALARVIDALGVELEDPFVGWDLSGGA